MGTSEPAPDPFVGLTIASEVHPEVKLRIERRLGEGGTAVAYFATRFGPEGASPVVMKVILPAIIAQAGDTARMVVQKEAVALGRLNERVPPSPFVVRLLDLGSLEYRGRGPPLSLPWLAIEYVHGGAEGATLTERVTRSVSETGSAFSAERALRALGHMTEGLREIHEVGVIHRDINPNNVLCCGSGQHEIFKISDFGIARPIGMQGTFGNSTVGTPGYISPEQASETEGPVGFASDIFSAAAVMFFVLTGEPYFDTKSFWQVLIAAKSSERRSILDAPALAPEIRADAETCRAIDLALAQATAADARHRPPSAKALAAALTPWLSSCPPTKRAVPVPGAGAHAAASSSGSWQFSLRHPLGYDWVLSRVGWDGDGHCLGAATHGVVYFDGTKWNDLPPHALSGLSGVRFASRVGAGRWLLGGSGGHVAEYGHAGVTRVLAGQRSGIELWDASGDLTELAAFVASEPGTPALLAATAAGRWLKTLAVPEAAGLLGITRVSDLEWLVVGRTLAGQGRAWLYRPLLWEATTLADVPARALTACASRPERELSLAVGTDGVTLRLERGRTELALIPGAPGLSSVALDVLGRAWAGGAGQLWFSPDGGRTWQLAWRDERWTAPFVSIFADVGMVFAATADGAVLECRSQLPG